MNNEFDTNEGNELMDVFSKKDKSRIEKAINKLSNIDFNDISIEAKEKIIELLRDSLPITGAPSWRLKLSLRCSMRNFP